MKLTNTKIVYYSLIFFILLYLVIYIIYIYPLSRLHELQTKEWATTLIKNTILGVKDKSYLYKIKIRRCRKKRKKYKGAYKNNSCRE